MRHRLVALTLLFLLAPLAAGQEKMKWETMTPAQKKLAEDTTREAWLGLGTAGLLGLACVAACSLGFAMVPAGVAAIRSHPNTLAIAALSLLLGWTCFGWVIALVWSLTAVERE